jgi:metallophosphoesterase (TIGR00282 family)
MLLLCVGDVVGQAGRRCLRRGLRRLRSQHSPDLIVVNGENAAGGIGLTPQTADEIFAAGADVITTGNHVWRRREILEYIASSERLLRPANYPDPAPGGGVCLMDAADGTAVAVINLMGRLFMEAIDDPFRAVDAILDELDGRAQVVLVDFHAEATSEKIAFGWYLDGRVSAVVGTHTHVPTADERILPGGTAYVTDLGMTGPYDSVIGVEKTGALERFLTQRPVRLSPADGDARLCGVLIEVGGNDGRALSIERVELSDGRTE